MFKNETRVYIYIHAYIHLQDRRRNQRRENL